MQPVVPPPLPSSLRSPAVGRAGLTLQPGVAPAHECQAIEFVGSEFPQGSSAPGSPPEGTWGSDSLLRGGRFYGVSGWLLSLLVHSLLLLCLLLMTFPLGTQFRESLQLSLGEESAVESPTFELTDAEEIPVESAEAPLAVENALDLVLKASVSEVVDPRSSYEVSTVNASALEAHVGREVKSADVTFFGTSASGRDFIFILDCSGSMHARNGERFERAREELLNSVGKLREEQRFYVYLFNWATTPMFGPAENPGQLIPATGENVAKLRAWLYTIYPESGTDPRRSLAESLQLKPDAIFLLSDGQFNTPNEPNPLLGWDTSRTSVFDVVGHKNAPRVQINTIAFEDFVAAQGMQRLAKESDGQFRFVPAPGRENQAFGDLPEADVDTGPEYEPTTSEAKVKMAQDILLLRRAERLATRDRRDQARALVKDLDPDKLPREARARLQAIRR